jgi:raffinose/stachyose/melibiose transport system permease protein
LYFVAFFWAATQLYPIIFMYLTSLKDNASIINSVFAPPAILNLQWQNYYTVLTGQYEGIEMGRYLLNSAIVSSASTAILVFLAAMAGYALARQSNRFFSTLSNVFLGLIAVPVQAIVIPLFFVVNNLGILNTYPALIFPYVSFAIPFSVLIAKAFFKSTGREVEEAARIDGASEWRLLISVVFPMARSLLAVLAIINFPTFWNELMLATVAITSNDMKTVPAGILAFRGRPEMAPRWDLMFSAMGVSTIPLIVFYALFQSQIIRGVTVGAVKG